MLNAWRRVMTLMRFTVGLVAMVIGTRFAVVVIDTVMGIGFTLMSAVMMMMMMMMLLWRRFNGVFMVMAMRSANAVIMVQLMVWTAIVSVLMAMVVMMTVAVAVMTATLIA